MTSQPSPCLLFVRRVTRAFMLSQGHDAATISALSITSARPGSIQARLKIGSHNVNRLGSVHGGLVCTLTDTMGSLALASKGLYSTGVSTDIHTTFSRPAGKPGDEVDITGEVVSLGRTLATTSVQLRHPTTGQVLAFGSHTKFVQKAWAHEENVEFDEEGEKVVKGKQPEEWEDIMLN